MPDRLAELGALQDAVINTETNPARLSLAGYIRGLFLDWSKNPSNPLTRLTARGRYYGYFWDRGIMPLSLDFANQNYVSNNGGLQARSFSDIINFSRTSNATVTRANGTIGFAPMNLLTFSEQFDNAAWAKTTTTVTANVIAAPDGTTTADTLTASGANSTTLQTYTAVAQPYTFSVWIRRRTGTGTVQITADGTTYSAVTLTSAFTRFETTITPTAGSRTAGIRIVTSGDAVDVWGADLEIGSTATTYNPTTVKNLLGFTESFDNAAWTKSNSFVQSNLLTYSEAFDNAAWTKTNSTITANDTLAPNGYQTADALVEAATSSTHLVASGGFGSGANNFTASVYLKANTRNFGFITLFSDNGSNRHTIVVDLLTAAITTTASSGTPIVVNSSATSVGNGWVRASITLTNTSGLCYLLSGISNVGLPAYSGVIPSYTGDGTSGIYIWGAQLVQGSVAGDYRRTDATALPVFYPNHNGVVCAQKLVENTATNSHFTNQTTTVVSGTRYTYSIYAKAGERNWLSIFLINTVNADNTFFNLSTGAIGNTQSGATASMTAVGNGWYRCSVTATTNSTTSGIYPGIASANGTTTFAGDGTSGIYVFGAQLSDSASLDPYVLNAGTAPTAQAYYGPRFDYDPVTLAPKGLLIEEQRANLLLNSSLAGTNLATQNVTVTAVAHTLSFYGTGQIVLSGTSSATVVGDGAYPTRKTLTFTPTAGTLTLTVTGTVQYAQLEIGSFATSFIPTAASQVTRAADVATIQGSNFFSWVNQNEGSLFSIGQGYAGTTVGNGNAAPTLCSLFDALYRSINMFRNDSGGSGRPSYTINPLNAEALIIAPVGVTFNTGLSLSLAGAYKLNDAAFAVSNSLVGTDTSVTLPLTSSFQIGRLGSTNTGYWNGTIKQISYFPQRLSNDVLKGLTA